MNISSVGIYGYTSFGSGSEVLYTLSGTFDADLEFVYSINGGFTWNSVYSGSQAVVDSHRIDTIGAVPFIAAWKCRTYRSGTAVVTINNNGDAETSKSHSFIHTSIGEGVDVAVYATAGTGTLADPYTGWDTAISWGPNIQYKLGTGVFQCSSSPAAWSQDNICITGNGWGTVLKFTVSGFALEGGIVNTGSTSIHNCVIGNFVIDGSGVCSYGMLRRGVSRSIFYNIRVRNVVDVGIDNRFIVLVADYNPRVSEDIGAYVMPAIHYQVRGRIDATDYSSGNTIINPIVEGNMNGVGINVCEKTFHTQFYGGSMETMNVGIAVGTDATSCQKIAFDNPDLENNFTDIDVTQGFNISFARAGALSSPISVAINTPTGTFQYGETVTWSTTGATATFRILSSGVMKLNLLTGTWTDAATTGTLTGATSGATATLTGAGITTQPSVYVRAQAVDTQFMGGNISYKIQERGEATQFYGTAMRDSYFSSFSINTIQLNCRDFNTSTTITRIDRTDSYTPSSGDTLTLQKGNKIVSIINAGTTAALAIVFPPSPYQDQEFTLNTRGAITSLTTTSPSGTVGGTFTAAPMAANSGAKWIWNASLSWWMRLY